MAICEFYIGTFHLCCRISSGRTHFRAVKWGKRLLLHISAMPRIDHTHPTRGIDGRRRAVCWLALSSFNITRKLSRPTAESTNCVRTCAYIYARTRGIRYREFGIYERNDRPRFGDQYRARLARSRASSLRSPVRWIRNVGKHSEISLVKSRPRRGTELYRPEQFNRTQRGSLSLSPPPRVVEESPREYLPLSVAQRWVFRSSRWISKRVCRTR